MAYWLFKSELGDLGFFYHSVNEKQIVGVVEVCAEAHPDSTTDDPRWECVDVKAVAPLPRPVTLAEVKAEPRLSELALVRQSRLSVAEWRLICEMGGYQG
jgi:predicted RNA-binding protein with PUA-like domain